MKKYNSEFKSMIFELYKTGPSVKELSREYGVSEVTIYKCFNRIFPIGSIDDTEITLEQIKRIKQVILSYGSVRTEHYLKIGTIANKFMGRI